LLSRSELAKALMGIRVTQHRARAARLERDLQALGSSDSGGESLASLPDTSLGEGPRSAELVADLWARGSRLMHAIASAQGAQYIHILQPNQYVPGSKRLNTEEQKIAYDGESEYREDVPRGYRALRRRGEELARDGIAFHDLTMIFAEQEETIYIDTCCHYNWHGTVMLARAIVSRIDF
jgi:hypothetical protein